MSHATAQEKFDFMRSDAGGRFLVRDQEDSAFAIIYYNKDRTDMTLPHVGYFRSMIWNKVRNAPVPVAPARGLSFRQAIDDDIKDFVVEEFIDGVMINLVWDSVAEKWIPFTRTQIGATGHFYGKRSFAELFWETFHGVGLSDSFLDKSVAYSWVMQHPEERVIYATPYGIPRLFLINTTGPVSPTIQKFYAPVVIPKLTTLEDVKEFVWTEGRRSGPQFQGVCLKTPNGNRYKLRTNEYDEARWLRGNQAKRPYLWLERWSEGQLPRYLRLYPEEKCDAETLINGFKDATQELHTLYLKIYRSKEMPLGEAPRKYRKLLWDLHQSGGGAYFPNVRTFMNEQDTARKLWLLNYEERYGSAAAEQEAAPTLSPALALTLALKKLNTLTIPIGDAALPS